MSVLHAYTRPWAVFDVKNLEHRMLYAKFLKTRSWRDCPVQFVLDPDYSDITSMIENKLSVWYLNKELGSRIPDKPYQVPRETLGDYMAEVSWARLKSVHTIQPPKRRRQPKKEEPKG